MSTSFYLRNKLTAAEKQKLHDAVENDDFLTIDKLTDKMKPLCIGTRSAGWQFLWKHHNFKYFKNIIELSDWLSNGVIFDEYNQQYTIDEFIEAIKDFMDNPSLYDLKTYYSNIEELDLSMRRYSPENLKFYTKRCNVPDDVEVNEYGEFFINGYRFSISEYEY